MAKIEIGLQLGLSVSKQAKLCLVTKRCGVVVAKDISNWTSRFEWETSVWHHEPIVLIGTCANFRPVYLDKNDRWTTCFNKESICSCVPSSRQKMSKVFFSPPLLPAVRKCVETRRPKVLLLFLPAIKCRTCMRTFFFSRGVFVPINSPSFHHISNLFCTKEKMSWKDNLHTAQCLKFTCNFCSTKIGNIVWPKASGFQKLAKLTLFGIFNEVASKCKRSSLRSLM